MKTAKILWVGLLVLMTLSVNAQDRKYHFGLHCSPNLSWIKPDVEEVIYKSDGVIVGVSYGAVFEYCFTPNVGLVSGVNVMHTGGHMKYPFVQDAGSATADTGTLWRKYKLQYIEIPLFLKGSTGELLGDFSFFGKFGVGSAFNIKAKADDEFLSDKAGAEKSVVENKNVNDQVSFFRESLLIGIGAEYKLGKTAIIQMGLTFSNGFTDLLTEETTIKPIIKEKARANFVELNLGVIF